MMSFLFKKNPARLVLFDYGLEIVPISMKSHHLNMLLFIVPCRAKFC